jgi:hypothetical protein
MSAETSDIDWQARCVELTLENERMKDLLNEAYHALNWQGSEWLAKRIATTVHIRKVRA